MLHSLFWTLAGLVGAGGGVFVAALFLPHLALLLKAALDFVRSPIGELLAVLALGLLLFSSGWISGDIHGTSGTRAAWAADVEAKTRAATARELALMSEMRKTADTAAATDDSFTKTIDEKVNANAAAKTSARADCLPTGDDIRRLLSIR